MDLSWIDLWRIAVIAMALWMGLLVVRLAFTRWRDARHGVQDERTHPFIYVSYSLALFSVAGFRAAHLGDGDITAQLLASTAIVITGAIGLSQRVVIHSPLRRR